MVRFQNVTFVFRRAIVRKFFGPGSCFQKNISPTTFSKSQFQILESQVRGRINYVFQSTSRYFFRTSRSFLSALPLGKIFIVSQPPPAARSNCFGIWSVTPADASTLHIFEWACYGPIIDPALSFAFSFYVPPPLHTPKQNSFHVFMIGTILFKKSKMKSNVQKMKLKNRILMNEF